eukprot:10517937-Lingulodinium_polyedra.AAC.2
MATGALSHQEAGVVVLLHPSGSTKLLHPVTGEFYEVSKDCEIGFTEAGWCFIKDGGAEAPWRAAADIFGM